MTHKAATRAGLAVVLASSAAALLAEISAAEIAPAQVKSPWQLFPGQDGHRPAGAGIGLGGEEGVWIVTPTNAPHDEGEV